MLGVSVSLSLVSIHLALSLSPESSLPYKIQSDARGVVLETQLDGETQENSLALSWL